MVVVLRWTVWVAIVCMLKVELANPYAYLQEASTVSARTSEVSARTACIVHVTSKWCLDL